jgi:hypothetical protein
MVLKVKVVFGFNAFLVVLSMPIMIKSLKVPENRKINQETGLFGETKHQLTTNNKTSRIVFHELGVNFYLYAKLRAWKCNS